MKVPKSVVMRDPRQLLRELTHNDNRTKPEVAAVAGVSPGVLYRFMQDKSVGFDNVQKLLAVYDIELIPVRKEG